ncbi:hypothetical protein PR202_ga13475 [Eleusine coracana subsp. coracana]|uniref:Uncharacterized protein n=1 Tax=Eleusine coracana subsp. coracana TaxID=191504 RepID=A0AAV5CEZ9_ELECO|nr:hypothetical protein PR202_ga13475 [Eleusine coracana subsp. coracana]
MDQGHNRATYSTSNRAIPSSMGDDPECTATTRNLGSGMLAMDCINAVHSEVGLSNVLLRIDKIGRSQHAMEDLGDHREPSSSCSWHFMVGPGQQSDASGMYCKMMMHAQCVSSCRNISSISC